MSDDFEKPIFDGTYYSNPKSFSRWNGLPSFLKVVKWLFTKNESIIPSDKELNKTLPVINPVFDLTSKLSATWLGHATVFVRLESISLIIDPVWSCRCSPLEKIGLGPLRYRPTPCSIDDLPELNYGFISHNHYDHLDANAVYEISKRFPKMEWFVPKGLKKWMDDTANGNVVHELSWGENKNLTLGQQTYQFWSVPAQHWSQRGILDKNKSLWSGWVVCGKNHRFYYTGDTGFCREEFAKLGKKLGPFDLSVIPIGCYKPRNFMKSQHIDPEEAVEIHALTKSVNSLAVHWGTYEMGSAEHYLEPPSLLKKALEKRGLLTKNFFTLRHGSTWSIDKPLPEGANEVDELFVEKNKANTNEL